MHLRQQHISGKANGPECIALSTFQGRRYIVYGSDKIVIVYTDEFAHVQTFEGVPQPNGGGSDAAASSGTLASVAMCVGTGQVGFKVSLFCKVCPGLIRDSACRLQQHLRRA